MKTKFIFLNSFKVALVFLMLSVFLFCSCSNSAEPSEQSKNIVSSGKVQATAVPNIQLPSPPVSVPKTTETPSPAPLVYNARISIVGDLMVHEPQLEFAKSRSRNYDFSYSFIQTKSYLNNNDYLIGNLETTFSENIYTGYPMFKSPDALARALQATGFDCVTTANNHCNDSWEDGLLRTLSVLDNYGIEHTGTFASKEERDKPFIKEINGISFALISYTYGTNGLNLTEGKPWLANVLDETQIVDDIKTAKALNPDFIIVMPHMGNEYESYPHDIFKNWALTMLNAGADLVIAGHPHVLQPIEFYEIKDESGNIRNCTVAYSLGNFISSQRTEPREVGMILNLEFEKTNDSAQLKKTTYIPTYVTYRNADEKLDIKVVPIYDALKAAAEGKGNFSAADISRMQRAHAETSKMFLNESLPLEEIKPEYEIKIEYKPFE